MKTLRVIYHMMRADFFERTRRYSFLIMLGLVVWLGYAATTGIIIFIVPPNFVGEINSAWVGALMSMTVGFFLGWFGFYLVRGSVARDYETGVGQILATTPLSRPLYTLGKWLSNFAVLGVMVLILILAGVLMILFIGDAPLDLWALISPLLFLSLPLIALVAAIAVVFDTVTWLRGGLGNAVYWFLFLAILIPALYLSYSPVLDLTGIQLIGNSVGQSAFGAIPKAGPPFTFRILGNVANPRWFLYEGIDWSAGVLIWRFFFLLAAVGLALLAAALFDRFNPSRELRLRRQPTRVASEEPRQERPDALQPLRLTPLDSSLGLQFWGLYRSEVRLLLKGRPLWWYAVSLGFIIAQLVVSQQYVPLLLAVAWLWLIIPLNELGNREVMHRTREIVFSAPQPTLNQLPPLWLAAISLVALVGSGALLHFAWLGRTDQMLAWLSGILFIPALATALGVLTDSRKLFEVVYVAWMYLIMDGRRALDFVGVSQDTPWLTYVLLAVGLFAFTALLRHLRLSGWRLRLRQANA